jgi:hypothetical protein
VFGSSAGWVDRGAASAHAADGVSVSYRGGGLLPHEAAAASAASVHTLGPVPLSVPVLCGWQLQRAGGSSATQAGGTPKSRGGAQASQASVAAASSRTASASTGSLELQLCAAPAAVAGSLVGKGVQQLPAQWSMPVKVELQGVLGAAGPSSILQLPLLLPPSNTAPGAAGGALDAAAAGAGGDAAVFGRGTPPPGGMPRNSGSSAALASLAGSAGGATGGAGDSGSGATVLLPAAQQRQRRTRVGGGRLPFGVRAPQTAQYQQGACYVSVAASPVPFGGGAWAVHLLPTYLLVNSLGCEVQIRQHGSELVLQAVPPGGHACVLWPDASLPLKLQFRVAEAGWSWSGAAAVDSPGEFLVK